MNANFLQLRREAWKFQDFNGVWTRNLAIPVRRSNQLSYEATDVGSLGPFLKSPENCQPLVLESRSFNMISR